MQTRRSVRTSFHGSNYMVSFSARASDNAAVISKRMVTIMPRRNPDATRARILTAALELFAAHGFAGTRIDAVASRSGANKRMIYHYFGGKEALFEAVLRHRLGETPWTGEGQLDTDVARLIAWEGLERAGPVAARARSEAMRSSVRALEARLAQRAEGWRADPALLALVLVSARLLPRIAPKFAALIDGGRPDFEARYEALLETLADAPAPPAPTARPRVTLRPNVTGAGL